jgi:NADH-quinone oxidoreductase subunit J
MYLALFIFFGALCVAAALNLLLQRHPINSALSLIVVMSSLAVLYLLLGAEFLAAAQVIVYAGAVMVLFIFIIALLSPSDEDRPRFDLRTVAGLVCAIAISGAVFALAAKDVPASGAQFPGAQYGAASDVAPNYSSFAFTETDVNANGNVQTVAGQLFTTYVLPFEITSLILLVSVIGAVYLTRKKKAMA